MTKATTGLQGVTLRRGGREILDNATLFLPDAGTLALVGPGARPLLCLLAGLIRPSRGAIVVGGENATGWSPGRRRLAWIPRELGLFASMTAAAQIAFAAGGDRTAVADVLGSCGLTHRARARPGRLTRGDRIRLAIARALAARPRALLVEEPIAGLDRDEAEAVLGLLGRASRDLPIVVASAGPTVALATGAETIVVSDGVLQPHGRAASLYAAPPNLAVASIMGPLVRFAGRRLAEDDGEFARVILDTGPEVEARLADAGPGQRCVVAIRPEQLAVAAVRADEIADHAVAARVLSLADRGDHLRLRLTVADGRSEPAEIVAIRPAAASRAGLRAGAEVAVAWQPHHASALRTEDAGR